MNKKNRLLHKKILLFPRTNPKQSAVHLAPLAQSIPCFSPNVQAIHFAEINRP